MVISFPIALSFYREGREGEREEEEGEREEETTGGGEMERMARLFRT